MADSKKDTKQPPTPEEAPKGRRRVKKSKGHGGHHGGAWKVAYADFVTAMMALFLVLWLVSQADTKLKEAIASYFRSPGVFDSVNGGVLAGAKKVSNEQSVSTTKDDEQALFSVAESLQKKFSTRPEFSKVKDQVKVDVTEEGLRIQIIDKADKVSFTSGSAELNPEATAILTEIAKGICGLPNKINIGGHTDSYVFPAAKGGYTNWELSADRANAARRVLQTVCAKPEQIRRIVGFADTEPMVPNDPFAPANRRISITVLRQPIADDEKNSENKDKEKSVIESDEKKLKDQRKETSANEKQATKSEPIEDSDNKGDTDTPEESTEKKTAKAKLKNEGAVTVGEPDIVPNKPQTKEAKKTEH